MSGPVTATLKSKLEIAPGVIDFEFALVEPAQLVFRAGQFVSLGVAKRADGSEIRRSYSISSPAQHAERLRLILKLIPGGTATEFWTHLVPGQTTAMTGPHGFFVLDAAHAGDVVFAATGTGIAPVLSMLDELATRTEPGRRIVYWGVRHESDLFAVADLEAACRKAGAQLFIYLSAPAPTWTGGHGRITAAVLDALPTFKDPVFYVVGNGAMIDELKAGLQARGVNRKKQIRTESFF